MTTSHLFISDGLGKAASRKRYQARRQRLMATLNAPMIIWGVDHGAGHPHQWYSAEPYVFQEPLLLYLTGINQTQTALFLNPTDKKNPETLLLMPKNPKLEFWEGERFGAGDAKTEKTIQDLTGISKVVSIETWADVVMAALRKRRSKTIYTLWHERQPGKPIRDTHFDFRNRLKRTLKKADLDVEVASMSRAQWEDRLVLDKTDIVNLQTANRMAATAFEKTASHIRAAKTEHDVFRYLTFYLAEETVYGLSFPPIVAAGQNATVLHYTQNDAPIPPKSLMLLDFGCRYQSMHADISRVVPVSGKFNPLQKALYEIVLATQVHVEAILKPGMSISELNTQAWDKLEADLADFLEKHDGKVDRSYDKSPHNIGHFVGLQVHDGDPNRNYRDEPLKLNQCITNEPGLYGYFEATIRGRRYTERLGIRIEDTLRVTARGCANLNADCPKTVEEIEALVGR